MIRRVSKRHIFILCFLAIMLGIHIVLYIVKRQFSNHLYTPESDCVSAIEGDDAALQRLQHHPNAFSFLVSQADDYLQWTPDCDVFKYKFGYLNYEVSNEELEMPIAFSILVYSNVIQVERLLHAIYRPHNVYCLHIDAKTSKEFQSVLQSIARCFHNVILPPRTVEVYWGEMSVLDAEMACLRVLWQYTHWRYFINLTGQDFPLKTNQEMVKILSIYNGANDISFSKIANPYLYKVIFEKLMQQDNRLHLTRNANKTKGAVPYNLTLYKGSTHIVASRAFVDFMLHDRKSQVLYEWLRNTFIPDEHYFSTLNHNIQLRAPGAYTGKQAAYYTVTRLKMWENQKNVQCHGEWYRSVCSLDLEDMRQFTSSPALFANKIRLEWHPNAFFCAKHWHAVKTYNNFLPLNLSYYENLPFVKHHI